MALLQFLDVNEGRTLELECHHKYLALSAANALIKYVEFSQGGGNGNTLRCPCDSFHNLPVLFRKV